MFRCVRKSSTLMNIVRSLTVGVCMFIVAANLFQIATESNFEEGRIILDHVTHPGVVVKVEGSGLGNQLFKYASSFAAARKLNVPLYIVNPDDSALIDFIGNNKPLTDPLSRNFMLDLFDLPEGNWVTKNSWEAKDIKTFTCEELLYNKIPKKYVETKLLLNSDYCHSEKYFENFTQEIKDHLYPKLDTTSDAFTFWRDLIHLTNSKDDTVSVAIHIRRGDYLKRKYWATPISFFRKGIQEIKKQFPKKKIAFFIFSDDIKYAKENLFKLGTDAKDLIWLSHDDQIHFVSGSHGIATNLEEFVLMSNCKSMIISNSTFSWWAAYLKTEIKDSVIIAPKFHPKFLDHVKDKHHRSFKKFMWKYKYPSDWIQIDPYDGLGL